MTEVYRLENGLTRLLLFLNFLLDMKKTLQDTYLFVNNIILLREQSPINSKMD